MQQIADWLDQLGMSEYAERFAENRIDFSVLPDLTDQDLEKIGVILGDRRKMLRAIAALNSGPPAVAPAAPEVASALMKPTPLEAPPSQPHAATGAVGERRYLTVMFCDLVGSTAISAQLDAEEWRDVVGAYLDAASAAVTELGGHVANKLGDGLMARFGYPIAQENDAERAVRAALSIQKALVELNRKNAGLGKPALAARIAIDTGQVVVNAAGEIFGDVPNIAARVQALAAPGAVVVTARTQRQVAGLFVVEQLGSHQLRGVSQPVILFRIVRASGGGRRAGQRNFTTFVGREEEVAVLMRRWEQARLGDGQLVLIVGEPGLGKSRLIDEFHVRLRDVPHTWVEWSCSQLLQYTPLHPITEWGRIRFGSSDVPDERRLADLENSLAQVNLDPVKNAALLAPLINISLPPERVPTLAPEELRRRQLTLLTDWVMAGARVQPLVLTVEDLHWVDPTTLDLLSSIAQRGALAPLFVLVTTRPEFRPSWGMLPHHAIISLAPLDRPWIRRMIGELVVAHHSLSNNLVESVAERSGGVPLFVEEVTRLLLERDEQGGTQSIPPTLQQSLTARLDRLGSAREVAQIGAVIGRDFSYTLLRAVAGMDESVLQAALDRLAAANLLLVQGLPPNSDYRFKHALIQDAAYENLLKSRRQVLHRRVAEALHENMANAVVEPELLAHHFTQAGLTEAAIEWWGKAGQRSLRHSALVEAVEQLTRALAQITTLPSTPALRREQIALQVALVIALGHVKGFAASDTTVAVEQARLLIERAEALGERSEDSLLLFSVLYASWVANYVAFNGGAICDLALEFLTLAEKQGATLPLAMGHRLMGIALLCTGDMPRSRTHLDRALALYDPSAHRLQARHFSLDVGIVALTSRSWARWMLGFPEAALADAEYAVKEAREIGQVGELMHALVFASLTFFLCGKYDAAQAHTDEVAALATEKSAMFWKACGILGQGCICASTGKASSAAQLITSGLAAFQSTRATVGTPFYLSYLARAYADLGQFDDAWRCVDEALTRIETTGETLFEANLHRVAGEIALKLPNPDTAKAEAHLGRAIAVARRQQAKSWELSAAVSMARLWCEHGKRDAARDLLAPVYDWFSEGFDTLDLREAKILLDNFSS